MISRWMRFPSQVVLALALGAILGLLPGCKRKVAARPTPCREIRSYDECEKAPGCIAIRLNVGPEPRGRLWECEPRPAK